MLEKALLNGKLCKMHPRGRYRKGADEERRIVNLFRKQGCVALRSAGSHSPIDIVVVDHKIREIKLIQSKLGRLSLNEGSEIIDNGIKLNGTYRVVFELWNGNTIY